MSEIDFDKAIERIQNGHKTTGKYADGEGGFCILGALGYMNTMVDYDERRVMEEAALAGVKAVAPEYYEYCKYDDPFEIITGYNDLPSTTTEDILLVLKQSKAIYEKETR